MIQTTQEGPSQIGTSLKTILARFNAINSETGEMNEELNKVQKAYESVGITFTDQNGQIRNAYDLLGDLAGIWDTLDKNTKSYLATVNAGVRMQSRFFAIMSSFDTIEGTLGDLHASAGVLDEGFETALTSVEKNAQAARVALEEMWIDTISSEALIKYYKLTEVLLKIVNKIGLVRIAGAALAVVLGITLPKAIGGLTAFLTRATSSLVTKTAALGANATASALSTSANLTLGASFKALGFSIVSATKALGAFLLAFATTPLGWLTIGIVAVTGAVAALTVASKKQEEAWQKQIETAREAVSAYKEAQNSTIQLEAESEQLINRYKELSEKAELSTSEQSEFSRISDELARLFPELVVEVDKYGNKIVDLGENYGKVTEAIKEMRIEKAKTFLEEDAGNVLDVATGSLHSEESLELEQEKIKKAQELEKIYELQGGNLKEQIEFLEIQIKSAGRRRANNKEALEAQLAELKLIGEGNSASEEMIENLKAKRAENEQILNSVNSISDAWLVVNQELTNSTPLIEKMVRNFAQSEDVLEKIANADTKEEKWKIMNQELTNITDLMKNSGIESFSKKIQLMNQNFDPTKVAGYETRIEKLRIELEKLIQKHPELGGLMGIFEDMTIDTDPISLMTAQVNTFSDSVKDAWSQTEQLISDSEKLDSVARQLAEGQALNASQMMELVNLYPELREHIKSNAEGYYFEADMLEEVKKGRIDELITTLEAERSKTEVTIQGTKTRLEALKAEREAMYAHIQALRDLAGVARQQSVTNNGVTYESDAQIGLAGNLRESNAAYEENESAIKAAEKSLREANAQYEDSSASLEVLNGILDKAGKGITDLGERTGGKGGGGGKSAKDSFKEFSQEIDLVERKLKKLSDRISLLGPLLSNTMDPFEKGFIMDSIIDAEENRLGALEQGLQQYNQLAKEAFAYIPKELRSMIKSGSVDQALLQVTSGIYGEYAEGIYEAIQNYDKWADAAQSTQQEILNLNQTLRQMETDKFNNQFAVTTQAIERLQHSLSTADINPFIDQEKILLEINELLEQDLIKVHEAITDLNAEYDAGKISVDEYMAKSEAMYQQQERIESQLVQYRREFQDVQQDRLRSIESVENKVIEIIKKRVELEKQALRDQLSEYEKYVNGKLKLLDDEFAEEDYYKDLENMQSESSELEKQLLLLSLDDSQWAANERRRIQEEIAEIENQIEELKIERSRTLRREAYNEAVEQERDRVEEKEAELDKELEADRLYAESAEAIATGMIEGINGELQTLEEAYIEFENKYGTGMSILGEKTKSEFIAEIANAKVAFQDLESGSSQNIRSLESVYAGFKNKYSRGVIDMVNSNGKLEGSLNRAKGKVNNLNTTANTTTTRFKQVRSAAKDAASGVSGSANSMVKSLGRINSAAKDVVDSLKEIQKHDGGHSGRPSIVAPGGGFTYEAFDSGGVVDFTGPASLHGTPSRPEAVFNTPQLNKLFAILNGKANYIKEFMPDINRNRGRASVPSLPPIIIKEMFHVKGNLDKDTVKDLQGLTKQVAREINNQLGLRGAGIRPH
ncbi:MAG: hypothetical protein ACQERJ_04850, partial [Bacillota bacterium]